MLLAGRVQLRHRRAATPPADAARSSEMPKSSAPEFRIKDGSRLHSGECAQSVDVLIPARRRSTQSPTLRPQANLPSLAFAGLASDLPGPKTRAAIWSTAAWQSRRRSTPKVFADLTRDHVLSTVSPAQQGRALGYSSEITVAWAAGTLRHPWRSFFFKNPSFDCIVA